MQAEQQADSSPPQSTAPAEGQEAHGRDTAPYTLKVSNHLGDVRLQSKPHVERDQVLYFTAQWKQDGGGVYDVTKLTNPEVSHCANSQLLHTYVRSRKHQVDQEKPLHWHDMYISEQFHGQVRSYTWSN